MLGDVVDDECVFFYVVDYVFVVVVVEIVGFEGGILFGSFVGVVVGGIFFDVEFFDVVGVGIDFDFWKDIVVFVVVVVGEFVVGGDCGYVDVVEKILVVVGVGVVDEECGGFVLVVGFDFGDDGMDFGYFLSDDFFDVVD